MEYFLYLILSASYLSGALFFACFSRNTTAAYEIYKMPTDEMGGAVNCELATALKVGFPYVIACALTAAWALAVAILTPNNWVTITLEVFQMLGWFSLLLVLLGRFVRHQISLRYWLGVGVSGVAIILIAATSFVTRNTTSLASLSIDFRIILEAATLVLVENIYRNAPSDARWHLNLPCIAVSGMAIYALFLYGNVELHNGLSKLFINGRAIAYSLVVPLLIVGAYRQRRWRRAISVSRSVAFYSTALLLCGAFLFALGAVGTIFRGYGARWGAVTEIALLFAGVVWVAILLTSASARSGLMLMVLNHFFAKRFDYQFEWTRCLETLYMTDVSPLEQRMIRALADCVDSPAGALFLRAGTDAMSNFVFARSWNWPERETVISSEALIAERQCGKVCIIAEMSDTSPWKQSYPDGWLVVPLADPSNSVPMGVILLAHSRVPFDADREVIDLLSIAAKEISLVLAEHRAATELAYVKRFEETGKRFSFVAHDIKNISNQLSLLLNNAAAHMDNIEFRNDMLVTLRASVNKINVMLMRLNSPRNSGQSFANPSERLQVLTNTTERYSRRAITLETDGKAGLIATDDHNFDAMVTHLLDNAIDASTPDSPIRIVLTHTIDTITIEIVDLGSGMTAEFVRDRLFHPFTTFKSGGYGLGAFQARELARAANGRITVKTVLGEGTTMCLIFPMASTQALHVITKIKEEI
jgi:putative PEP-CTERM system histidine kinase